MRCDA